MALLRALEIMLGCLFVYGVVTQLALPLIRGTAPFPFFRKQRKLEHDIVEKRQQKFEHRLEEELREDTTETEKEKETI